jgi:nitroimidazol reductase NimA-like FMN-containing flavoprotein (pyridoxamine 5'-phosphate oxidase superfamily)
MTDSYKPTKKTKVKRLFKRAAYDKETVHAILDAALLCHVGYVIDGQPFVTPTIHWREGERLYWHGSAASQALRVQKTGVPVCVTVSMLDGLVLARSGFHHSVNYRSVMAFGQASAVEDPKAKEHHLDMLIERIAPGRIKEIRPVTKQELKGTTVVGMDLDEVVAKVRTGPPVDDEPDYDLDVWAGVLPIHQTVGEPVRDPKLKKGIRAPKYLKTFKIG